MLWLTIICRLNAIQLEEKEKKEKEVRNQIIEEANQFKEDFHKKRELACENNKAANREKEKVSSCLFPLFNFLTQISLPSKEEKIFAKVRRLIICSQSALLSYRLTRIDSGSQIASRN